MNEELNMANTNKINSVQKTIMAEFMAMHPSLAQNLITNCAQGKVISDSLWATLTQELNDTGPPVKDAKAWKKVFADQKYQAKKKLSFNKSLRYKKLSDSIYEQKRISLADQQILAASGVNVECFRPFGTNKPAEVHSPTASPISCSEIETSAPFAVKQERSLSIESIVSLNSIDQLDREQVHSGWEEENAYDTPETHGMITKRQLSQEDSIQSIANDSFHEEDDRNHVINTSGNIKRKLSEENYIESSNRTSVVHEDENTNYVSYTADDDHEHKKPKPSSKEEGTLKLLLHESQSAAFQQRIEAKLDRLLDIQEKIFKMKEEKHQSVIALNLIKLQIKTMELNKLKASQ